MQWSPVALFWWHLSLDLHLGHVTERTLHVWLEHLVP